MKRTTTMLAVTLVASVSACGEDLTTSDEYQALERETAALEQETVSLEEQLADANAELASVRAELVSTQAEIPAEVPEEVVALLDEWWAANDRRDGSVVDLYVPSGYHLYGDDRIHLDELAAHLDSPGYTHEWITEPYLVAAEPEGRYVVTRGVRNSIGSSSYASALTFEITTTADGELRIAQTTWLYVH